MPAMPHLDRFGAQDTPDEVQEQIYALLRKCTPEERLRMVFAHMQFARDLKAGAERWKAEHCDERSDNSSG
jgi:hypothetical protein